MYFKKKEKKRKGDRGLASSLVVVAVQAGKQARLARKQHGRKALVKSWWNNE